MKISQKIIAIMSMQKITQKDLAKALGMSQASISLKLKTDSFHISDLEKIAKFCNCGIEIVFTLPTGEKI